MKNKLINSLLLIVSYAILFFLPKELGVLSYTIFAVSIFLFIVGYFRIASGIDLQKKIGYKPAYFLNIILGMLAFAIGAVYLYIDCGSGKSMIVAFRRSQLAERKKRGDNSSLILNFTDYLFS